MQNRRLPRFQRQLETPRKNKDQRLATAYHVLQGTGSGIYIFYKTTRAGCTTALVAEALNRQEKFLTIVPTNKIADKTVIEDAVLYSDSETCDIIHIPSNHMCIKNEEMCMQHPDLKDLPILPLADNCSECEYFYSCPVTEIIHKQKMDGIVLTYQKLVALMLASGSRPNTQAERIIYKISTMYDIIFDEIHEIQYGKTTDTTVYRKTSAGKVERFDVEKYVPVMEEYTYIRKVLAAFGLLLSENNVEQAILEVFQDAEDRDYYKYKLSKPVENNYAEDVVAGASTKFAMAVYSEIIDLTINRHNFKISMPDIINIYNIMNIVTNERLIIHAIRDRGNITVKMVSIDTLYEKMLRAFITGLQAKEKRVVLTSATICSHNYTRYFLPDTKIKSVMFGLGGDPMDSNARMLILADTKKYGNLGRYSRRAQLPTITANIIKILNAYDDDDCTIITVSKYESMLLMQGLKEAGHPHLVTYYKAPEMMGVSSSARVMIAVGVAEKPANAFDAICSTKEESVVLREEAMHCDTWQAWSRVKDPAGKKPSIVFALGCSVEQCENIVTWGYGRTVQVHPYKKRQKKIVEVKTRGLTPISKPSVVKCMSFEEMEERGHLHKHVKNKSAEIKTNLPNYNSYITNRYIGSFKIISANIYNKCELLWMFVNRRDVYAEQAYDGSYFKVSGNITDTLLENHIAGKITIGAYSLNTENMVRWLCFDIDAHRDIDDTDKILENKQLKADYDMDKICRYLQEFGIPYLLEASGSAHSYHIWIFLVPVKAAVAKQFGKDVLKDTGVKCEIYPKQVSISSKKPYGNLVKLPFAKHRKNGNRSYIYHNGAYVSDFDVIEVGMVDISAVPVKTSPKQSGPSVPTVNGIREIFVWGLDQNLVGSEGHWMRIAIVREYYNSGIHDVAALAKLFSKQADYDFEISCKHVESIIGVDMGCWRWETLVENCGLLVAAWEKSRGDN